MKNTEKITTGSALKWWHKTTVYEIWPRSFKDTNNDGIGDIPGISSKLDYIKELGFETIWLAPFFSSPLRDVGYDLTDYRNISPEYGTMNDLEQLIAEVHKRGMRILFDLVMTYTSIEHPWFVESRSSRENPRRDWYIWRDGKGKNPPNNWITLTGVPAWQYDRDSGQWFYTSFLPFQPDLNYHNPAVKKEMFDTVRFWLKKGVDGFRLDIFNCTYKDTQFRNNPFSFKYLPKPHRLDEYNFQKKIYTINHPDSFILARELRSVLNEFSPARFLIGEVSGRDESIRQYLGEKQDALHSIFLFETVQYSWNASFFRKLIEKHNSLYAYPNVPTYVFSNHDVKRSIMRIKGDIRKAKLLALFQMTTRGIPVVYYGEEIGMKDGDLPLKGAIDPIANLYSWIPKWLIKLLGLHIQRDDYKTPMQWDENENAGFCSAGCSPWLPVNKDYHTINVKTQNSDQDSLLNTFRALLLIRNNSSALKEGVIEIPAGQKYNKNALIYERRCGSQHMRIIINFGRRQTVISHAAPCDKLIFAVGPAPIIERDITLAPNSGVILGN